jgi:SAM-dependent methyltransferase
MQPRFDFGNNWKVFNAKSDSSYIELSKSNLENLIGKETIFNKSVFDIGSGSGIHALSFLLLGAKKIKAIDLDTNSVEATRERLNKHDPEGKSWSSEVGDILQLTSNLKEGFDIVYSWGVLHHTGNMKEAIINAASFCKEGGCIVLGIYRKTTLCGFWKIEKLLYNYLPGVFRRFIDLSFGLSILFGKWIKGISPFDFLRDYKKLRGMDFMTDVRDWLGGYPYESASPNQIHDLLSGLGFKVVNSNVRENQFGLFGSGCNEYVYRRQKQIPDSK